MSEPAGRLLRLPRPQGGLPEPHGEKDPERRPDPLRVGQGRLQPESREPPQGPAAAGTTGIILAAKERKEHKDEDEI